MSAEHINWNIRIALAKQNGYFTELDSNLASDWMTCAVGENAQLTNLRPQDVWGERHRDGVEYATVADKANELGMQFMKAIVNGHKCPDDEDGFDPEYAAEAIQTAAELKPQIDAVWSELALLRQKLVADSVLEHSKFDSSDYEENLLRARDSNCADYGHRARDSNYSDESESEDEARE